jgi:hypothetical protein
MRPSTYLHRLGARHAHFAAHLWNALCSHCSQPSNKIRNPMVTTRTLNLVIKRTLRTYKIQSCDQTSALSKSKVF